MRYGGSDLEMPVFADCSFTKELFFSQNGSHFNEERFRLQ